MISFFEVPSNGSSKHIKVYKNNRVKSNHSKYNELKGKTSSVQIGRISYTTGNKFYYYEPPTNTSRPALIGEDIEVLKRKIINRKGG
jgi:hypothetical protein